MTSSKLFLNFACLVMEFTIYSLGNVDFLAQILNAVAMICGTGNYVTLVSVGFLIGLLFIGFQAIFQGAQRINLQQTLVCFIVYLCMFGPSCTVLIEDVYRGQVRNVDNVPLGVGVSGMAISNIGYSLTKLMEQGFADVDRTTEHGFAESLRILNELRILNTDKDRMWQVVDRELGEWGQGRSNSQQAMRNYLSECIFVDVMLKRIPSASTLAGTPWSDAEVWQSRSEAHAVYIPVTGTNAQTGIVSCSQAYDILDRAVMRRIASNTFQDWVTDRLNGVDSPDATAPATESALVSMGMAQDRVQDFMQALAINSVYEDAVSDFHLTYHDQVTAAAIRQAQIQRNTQWASEGTMFLAAARALMAFFEGFVYAITPIMGFLIATGAFGLNLVGKFFLLVVWIQLWLPILSITNLYINIAARSAVQTALGDIPSIYTINEMWAQTATWVATGGMMAAATPMIALFLITGSTYAFTTLTNRLGGQDHFNERATSPDAITTGAVMARASAYNANRTMGVLQTGAESQMKNINVGRAFSANESESKSYVEGLNKQLNAAFRQSIIDGQRIEGMNSLSTGARESVQSAITQANKASNTDKVSQAEGASQTAQNTDRITFGTRAGMGASADAVGFGEAVYKNLAQPGSADLNPKGVPASGGKQPGLIEKVGGFVGNFARGSVSGSGNYASDNIHQSTEGSTKSSSNEQAAARERSLGNQFTDTHAVDFTKMTSDQMAEFGMANKNSEIGRIATEMASAMKTYETAKQASTTFGSSTSVSLAAVTNNMSEDDARDLDNYFKFNHADKAEQIQQQAEKYGRLFGFDAARGKMAAQIDFLTESSDKQDLAFAGRILADNQMPIPSRDPASMQPEGTNFEQKEKELKAKNKGIEAEAHTHQKQVNDKIKDKDEALKPVDRKEAREDVSKENVKNLKRVDVAGNAMENKVQAEARRTSWRDLMDSPEIGMGGQITHLLASEGAENVVRHLINQGISPTQGGEYIAGGHKEQSITGLTQAQREVVDKIASGTWQDVDMSAVRQELRLAHFGMGKLTEAQEKELDKATAATKEHLTAVAFTGNQSVAAPVVNFNTAHNLRPDKGQ